MGTISESRWREIEQANQQVSVVGRSLLLGTGTGFFSGAGMGLAMTVMEPEQIAAALQIGGLFGSITGLIFGALLAPFVVWRAGVCRGRPSGLERVTFGCLAILPIVVPAQLFLGKAVWEGALPSFAVAFVIAAVCTAVFLGWCMRPFDQGGPRSVTES